MMGYCGCRNTTIATKAENTRMIDNPVQAPDPASDPPSAQAPSLAGIINLDKPAGLSSAAAVNRVKRLLPRGTRIGHAGTLDPFATGVLLLLIGKATRSCEAMMSLPKRYETTIKLGAGTATDDPESPESPSPPDSIPTLDDIRGALRDFIGLIPQRPPVFSAIKFAGRRACDLARQGNPPALRPRIVRVDAIQIIRYDWPLLELRIDCGRGVYIRSIARDLGRRVATAGYLTQLRRTRTGHFDIADAATLEQLQGGIRQFLQPMNSGAPIPA